MALRTNGILSGVGRGVLLSARGVFNSLSLIQNGVLIDTPGSYTFLIPDNVIGFTVEGWGGGGGGGSRGGTIYGGGGGGAGGYFRQDSFPVTPGSTIDVVIGSPGSGGASTSYPSPGSNGTDGGDTQLGLFVAYGGKKGTGGGNLTYGVGGAGGTAEPETDVYSTGQSGGNSVAPGNGGAGGSTTGSGASETGIGGSGGTVAGDVQPTAGQSPGGGGGGGTASTVSPGKAGGPGAIKFTWSAELLDSFESISGDFPVGNPYGIIWEYIEPSSGDASYSISPDWASDQFYSYRITLNSPTLEAGIKTNNLDLTNYSYIAVAVNSPDGAVATLYAADTDSSVYVESSGSGEDFLSLDITSLDRSEVKIWLFVTGSDGEYVEFDGLVGVF